MNLTVELLYDVMFVVMILLALLGNLATMCIIISKFSILLLYFTLFYTYGLAIGPVLIEYMSEAFVRNIKQRKYNFKPSKVFSLYANINLLILKFSNLKSSRLTH